MSLQWLVTWTTNGTLHIGKASGQVEYMRVWGAGWAELYRPKKILTLTTKEGVAHGTTLKPYYQGQGWTGTMILRPGECCFFFLFLSRRGWDVVRSTACKAD